jgi:predicted MFS family arabinose efflux permease
MHRTGCGVRVDSPAGEWRSSWRLVVAAAAGTMMVNLYVGTLGVLMPVLSSRFGWSRAQLSASVMIVCTGLLLLGPIAGMIIDRFGPRRVALTGTLLYCGALTLVALAGPQIWTWYIAWSLVAIANPLVNNLTWTTAITRAFALQRGLALSAGLSGVGIANFISPPLAIWSLSAFGWRGSYFTLALVGLMLVLPATLLLFVTPENSGSLEAPPVSDLCVDGPGAELRLSELLRNSQFWRLAACMVMVSAGIGTLVVHFQPIMRDAGLTAARAAGFAALLGPAAIAGRLAGGYMLDHLPLRPVAATAFALPALAAAMLLHYDASARFSVVCAIAIGLSLGIEGDVVAYLTANYFGLRFYTRSYGLLFGLFAFGAGFAPVLAGAVFDGSGSYDGMLKLLLVALLASAMIMITLGKPLSGRVRPA